MMKLNKKGQMIVLDVLFAITLMVLAFSLIFKVSETDIYSSNSRKNLEMLNRVGELSYNYLMNNSENGCFVIDNNNSFFIPGTINTNKVITKEGLAIPSNYKCFVSNLPVLGCIASPPANSEVFAITFDITTCQGNLTKQQYLSCIRKSTCPIGTASVTLKIWRDN